MVRLPIVGGMLASDPMPRIFSWTSEGDVPVLAGTILSSIFFVVGVAGTIAFGPRLLDYWNSASWVPVPAMVRSTTVVQYRARSTTARPGVRFDYEYGGQRYQSESYDTLDVFTSDFAWVESVVADLRARPGRTALVNPANPARAVLERGRPVNLVLLLVPPFFTMLGTIAGVLVGIRWRWLATGRPRTGTLGRFVTVWGGAAGRFFSNEFALKTMFYTGFLGVVATLGVISYLTDNWLIGGVALFFLFGLWRASRKR